MAHAQRSSWKPNWRDTDCPPAFGHDWYDFKCISYFQPVCVTGPVDEDQVEDRAFETEETSGQVEPQDESLKPPFKRPLWIKIAIAVATFVFGFAGMTRLKGDTQSVFFEVIQLATIQF